MHLTPSAVVYESSLERDLRERRKAEQADLLRAIEHTQEIRFRDAAHLMSWFFAMLEHMASAPALDPGREAIQGVQVDRDERIAWLGKTKRALEEVARQQDNSRGVRLLWLHFRQAKPVG